MLLLLEALAVVNPVFAISTTFTSAGSLGKTLGFGDIAGVVSTDLAMLVAPLVAILLLAAAWGILSGSRGSAALILQLPVLLISVLALTRPMTAVSIVPFGNWALTLLALLTSGVLFTVLRSREGFIPRRGWRRTWWLPTAYVAVVGLIAALASRSTSLPSDPTKLFAKDAEIVATTPAGGKPVDIAQNPHLAANPFNSIHNDAWATDSYNIPGPADPEKGRVESLFTGGDCATIAFDSRGRIVTACSTLKSAEFYLIDPDSLTVVARIHAGDRKPSFTDFSGGGYIFLDNKDQVVFAAQGGLIKVFSTGGDQPKFNLERSIDVASVLQEAENVQAVMPDWKGRYWFVGAKGTVGVVNSDGTGLHSHRLDGENIENSLAVGEDGAYVISSAAMYRFTAGADNAIDVAWRTTYDSGERLKPGQTSRASGTTPTIFAGGKLVAIADNAEPRMNVVVYDTKTGKQTCSVPVFGEGRSASENSLIAAGDIVLAENNYGYAPAPAAAMGGHTTQPGLAAVRVDTNTGTCSKLWENTEMSVPSVVSKASLATGQIFTYTKPRSLAGVDAWYFTAIDLKTGKVQWRRLAGTGLSFNNHYAGAYLSPKGDMFVGTLRGMVVLRNQQR